MVIEASHLLQSSVVDATGTKHGAVDTCVYIGDEARLYGLQLAKAGVITRFRGVRFADVLSVNQHAIIIDSPAVIEKDLKDFDAVAKATGPVVGVTAKTESGKKLGKISDVLLDADTGFIVRFYLRNLLSERIIPRQFLVSITPREVVFKDVVDTPLFTQVATAEAAPVV